MKSEVVAALSGVGVATVALIVTAIQVYLNRRVNIGNFWLKLEEMSHYYDNIHLKLRPGGAWQGQDMLGKYKGPKGPDEWATVEDYMGFFEHMKIMFDSKVIDKRTFNSIFDYRLGNIVANPIIVDEKLRRHGGGWTDFIKLLQEFEIKSRWYTMTPEGLEFRLPWP